MAEYEKLEMIVNRHLQINKEENTFNRVQEISNKLKYSDDFVDKVQNILWLDNQQSNQRVFN